VLPGTVIIVDICPNHYVDKFDGGLLLTEDTGPISSGVIKACENVENSRHP
jgi:hypothetical protein